MTRDGRHLAYVAFVGNRRQLYLRDMVTGQVGPVPGSDDAQDPFFSPDGAWIGFFAEHKLKKIPVAGGTPDILADAVTGHGGVWGPDQIYFTPGYSQPISRIAPGGGAVQPVTTLGSDSLHSLPSLVPDGSALLFTADKTILLTVDVLRLGTEQPARTIIDVGADARYVPTGHLVFGVDGRLLVAPFDRQTLQVTGTPTAILDDVRTEARGPLQAVWSDDGTLIYVPGPDMATARFVWLDRSGRQEPLAIAAGNFSQFALSPDGKQLALAIRDRAMRDIWVNEIGRGAQQRVTFSGSAAYPVWSRDGTSIFFMLKTATGSGVYQVRLGDSAGRLGRLSHRPVASTRSKARQPVSWSRPAETSCCCRQIRSRRRPVRNRISLPCSTIGIPGRCRGYRRTPTGWPTLPMRLDKPRFTDELPRPNP
jgi:Tol biopolymer transport system component